MSSFQVPEQLFRAICQANSDVILVVDRAGEIVFVNDRCRILLGYEPGELVGQRVEVLVPGSGPVHAKMRQVYQQAPASRPMGTRPVLNAVHKSGHTIPVEIHLSSLPPVAGNSGYVQAVVRDALPRWTVQQDLLVQSVAMDAAANGIVITDVRGVIHWVNPSATRITGYADHELIGQHTRLLKSGLHEDSFYRDLWETVSAGKTWYGEMANRRKDGTIYYEEQHIAPVHNELGETTHYIAIKQDVTARKKAELELKEANNELKRRLSEIEGLHQQLRQQAIRDPLTNLFNRRYLDEMLRREMARSVRERARLSLVLIDVDGFKELNDQAGHSAGDTVLVQLADLLNSLFRASDIVCRYGGDEFVVVMPVAGLTDAIRRAEHVRTGFAREMGSTKQAGQCSLSIGVAEYRRGAETLESMLKRADDALYEAKRQGRNRVVAAG